MPRTGPVESFDTIPLDSSNSCRRQITFAFPTLGPASSPFSSAFHCLRGLIFQNDIKVVLEANTVFFPPDAMTASRPLAIALALSAVASLDMRWQPP